MKNNTWMWFDDGPPVSAIFAGKVEDEDEREAGTVILRLEARQLNADGTSNAYDHLEGNPNVTDANTVGAWITVKELDVFVPDETWTVVETSSYNINDGWDGAAVRIKIINELTDIDGDPIPLWVDNARVQDS